MVKTIIAIFLLMYSSEPEQLAKEMTITLPKKSINVDAGLVNRLIQEGEMVIIDESVQEIPWMLSAGIGINASQEEVWNTISNFRGYPNWVPSCQSIDVKQLNERVFDLTYHLGFKFILLPFTVDYTVRHLNTPPHRTDWVGLGGEIEKTYGWFEVVPVEDNRSLYFYNVWAIPGSGFLKKWYEKYPILDIGIGMAAGVIYAQTLKEYIEKNKPPVQHVYKELTSDEKLEVMKALTNRGPVMIFPPSDSGSKMKIEGWIKVDAPVEDVWNALTDFEAFPYFEDILKSVKVIKKTDTSAEVSFVYDLKLTIISISPEFTLGYTLDKNKSLMWKVLSGDEYVPEGGWELYPLDSRRTLLKYWSLYDNNGLGRFVRLILSIFPQGRLAVNSFVTQQTMRDMRKWAETPLSDKEKIYAKIKKKKGTALDF